MKIIRSIALCTLVMAASASLFAATSTPVNCNTDANVEEFRYSWRLRGGVRFLAGLVFPTTGVGNLRTTYDGHGIHSELLITAPSGKQGGFYAYESDMDERGTKTLTTYHGYEWGKKARNERTVFDYVKRLARIHKETPEETENRVKKLPAGDDEMRDILTAIHYLRQNASSITAAMNTTIYSDGKEYPVIFKPGQRRSFVINGKATPALGFEIVDAPGGKKWQGGVKVWLSDDERRIPVRIDIVQSMASLQLDLKSADACAFQMASR